ncbi:MAG: hypothetical protein EU541_05365 [Promethearchaeota archaeon]|nr:MAG: hypothetical protein EU541_05365 [Candidatus Lokiarchaeota archaeon]
MSNSKMEKDKEEFIREIKEFKKARPKYVLLSKVILKVLQKIEQRIGKGIVETRAKDIVSFAEKIQRPGKKKKYSSNPIQDLTDLCGGRCIFPTLKGVEECSKLIEKEFRVFWEESEDKLKNLGVSQFGYLSKHYIVQLNLESSLLIDLTFQRISSCQDSGKKSEISYQDYEVIERNYEDEDEECDGIGVSEEMRKHIFEGMETLYSEIQVRTLLQHAWSEIAHDRIYKSEFPIPDNIQRTFNRVSAILENTDAGFQEMIDNLDMYVENYGAYMTDQEMKEEINRFKTVVEIAPNLEKVEKYVYRIVSLARSIEEGKDFKKWEEIIALLKWYQQKVGLTPRLKREYGLALSKSAPSTDSSQYLRAKNIIKESIEENPKDSDAYSILGGWWKAKGDLDKALKYYEKAYINDPDDSYAVGNYFILEISHNDNYQILQYSRPIFKNVIAKCIDKKEIGVNIPWVYFDLGLFNLFLGNIIEALINYLTAIRYSNASWMITTTLKTINLLYKFEDKIIGLRQVKQLLLLGLISRFQDQNSIEELKNKYDIKNARFEKNIIIIAGSMPKTQMNTKRLIENSLLEIYTNETFTLISRRIEGKAIKYKKSYLNLSDETLKTAKINQKLAEITKSDISLEEGNQIKNNKIVTQNVQEIIQYWAEILLNRKSVKNIKVIGVGVDPLTSFEYRAALVFGCQVGVFRDLSVINSQLFEDKDYFPSKVYTEEEFEELSEKEKLKIEKHPIRLFNLSGRSNKSLIQFFNSPYKENPI